MFRFDIEVQQRGNQMVDTLELKNQEIVDTPVETEAEQKARIHRECLEYNTRMEQWQRDTAAWRAQQPVYEMPEHVAVVVARLSEKLEISRKKWLRKAKKEKIITG